MGFSGGGSNVLKPHKHSNAVQDGSPLNMNNVTEAALSGGDIVYSDGNALQRLAIGTPAQQLKVNAGATAPEYFTPSAAASTWVKLGSTTLGAPAQWMDVQWALADVKDFLRIYVWAPAGAGTIRRYLSFFDSAGNVDIGLNYNTTFSTNNGALGSSGANNGVNGYDGNDEADFIDVSCSLATEEKLTHTICVNNVAGVANATTVRECYGKWADTTNEIRGVRIWNTSGAATYAAGASVLVLGTDL